MFGAMIRSPQSELSQVVSARSRTVLNRGHSFLCLHKCSVFHRHDSEVAKSWLMLCPVPKTVDRALEEPNEIELNTIRDDPQKLATIRLRLNDIGWWMRLLCQQVAARANHQGQEMSKFWQSRFEAVRLLNEPALQACATSVDLNPIRAAMAQTLEKSDYTSAQRRVQAV